MSDEDEFKISPQTRKTLDNVLEAIEKHKGTYGKAIAGFAFSKNADEALRPCYGFVTFVSEEATSLKELDYDYGSLVIVKKLLEVDDAAHMLQQMYEKHKITLKGHPSIQFRGRLHNPQFVGSRYQYGYVKCRWPILYASGGIDESVLGKIPRDSTSSLQLPLFPSGDEAIRVLLDLEVPEGFYQLNNTIEIVVPDLRCRIDNLSLSGLEVTLEVDLNQVKAEDVVAKFYARGERRASTSEDLTLEEGRAVFVADEEPRRVEAQLLSVRDGDVIDQIDFDYRRTPMKGVSIAEDIEATLLHIIDRGEGQHVEFKRELAKGSPKEFLETIASFANTRGGKIIIGVNDNGEVIGAGKDVRNDIENMIAEHFDPPVTVEITSGLNLHGKPITLIDVPEGGDKPYILRRWGIFVRRGSSDRQVRRRELDEMYGSKQSF